MEKVLDASELQPSDTEYFLAFARGEIGMLIDYWGSMGHAQPKPEWGVAPLPGGDRIPGIPTLAMVAAKAENPEGGFALASFAAGATGAQAVVRMPGAPVPGYMDETVKSQWLAHSGLKEEGAFVLKQRYLPAEAYPDELAVILRNSRRP